MGTRSLTVFVENWKYSDREKGEQSGSDEIVVMYRQMDGYATGHGQELVDFLKPYSLVNGISMLRDEGKKIANGMGCLALQTVAHFKYSYATDDKGQPKLSAGGFYLYKSGTRDTGEEWIYTVYNDLKSGKIHLKVQSGSVTFFGMPGTKQDNMPVLFDGPVEKFNAEKIEKKLKKLYEKIPNDFIEGQKAGAEMAKKVTKKRKVILASNPNN